MRPERKSWSICCGLKADWRGSKEHPDDKDLAATVEFYNGLTEQPVFLK